jgi:hypothetical protein
MAKANMGRVIGSTTTTEAAKTKAGLIVAELQALEPLLRTRKDQE